MVGNCKILIDRLRRTGGDIERIRKKVRKVSIREIESDELAQARDKKKIFDLAERLTVA